MSKSNGKQYSEIRWRRDVYPSAFSSRGMRVSKLSPLWGRTCGKIWKVICTWLLFLLPPEGQQKAITTMGRLIPLLTTWRFCIHFLFLYA